MANQRQKEQDTGEEAAMALKGIGKQYLAFSLSDREFAVAAELIQSVERLGNITRVPTIAPWVKGIVNLRGSIVSVVDLRMFLNQEPSPTGPHTRLLSLQWNEMVICLLVDSVSEMLLIPPTAIVNAMDSQSENGGRRGAAQAALIPSWIAPYAAGCAVLENRVIVLLDAAKLLFSEKMQRY